LEECFLSSKVTLAKPNGGVFTSREISIISCILNGGTAKAISAVLGISHHTVSTHIGKIRNDLNLSSQDRIIKFVESSDNYIQIRERYIDLLLFNKFREMLREINALKISPKYGCVVHAKVEEIDKYILLDYLKLAKINADISRGSAEYAEDKFHIICYPTEMNLENLNSDNIVVSENHNNNVIDLTGQCIESNGSGTQYKSYFSLLGCISKIYSSKTVDDILNEFKEYYFKIKDKKFHSNPERNYIEITDKGKSKIIFAMLFFIALLSLPTTIYWYSETHETHLTNINMLIGEDIFLKRKDLTSKMDEILEKQKGVKFLVLVGQGGIGKTTLARHYINKNNAKIKWEINAATEESSIKSLLELAIELSKTNSEKREELKYIQAIEDPEIKQKSAI
jgi:DNA-binding CsgD family transcriptional regulator